MQEIINKIVSQIEQLTKVQMNLVNTVVRQSTLIAKLNERVIKLETDKPAASAAAKVLRNPKSSKAAKTAAGLALTQKLKR